MPRGILGVMLSVLIVNTSGGRTVGRCLGSIREHVAVPCEVVIVGDRIADQPPIEGLQLRTVPAGPDLTFAAAADLAAHHATGKYLLLLASDAVLLTSIGEALRVLDSDATIGVVGAEMYSHQGRYLTACALFPTPMRLWSFARMWRVPVDTWKYIGGVPVRRCDYVDASFLMVRASAWDAVQGMDPENSFYGDEMDLCRRLLDDGHLTVQVPTIHYAHAGGYTPDRMAHLFGGFRRYHRRFSGPFTRVQAGLALRMGLMLRLPLYWWKSRHGTDSDRLAFHSALDLHRNWSQTGDKAAHTPSGKP